MKHLRIDFSDLSLWLTNESIEMSIQYLTASQITAADQFKLHSKRQDFLRSRALVNYATGTVRPYVPRSELVVRHGDYFASISHKEQYCAALTSMSKSLLGVDIELLGRDRSTLRKKVLSTSEMAAFDELDLPSLYAFSFKEAVFKCLHTTYPEVRYFHQCEITNFTDHQFQARILLPSLPHLRILGRAFKLTTPAGEYVITVAYS
jgi:phosphopantetheinyl transferase (holo-ACP synthase)